MFYRQYWTEDPAIIIHSLLVQAAPVETYTGSFFSILERTSTFGWLILALLLVFSILSWAIIVRKWMTFKKIERQGEAFVAFFRKSARLSEVNAASEHYSGSPLPGLFSAAYQELNAQLQIAKEKTAETSANPGHPVLTDRNITGIQRALQRAAAAELSILERNMSWLATTGSVTPFIGLLGTVVGIIYAFQGLAFEGTTSIQAVAPGIAEALVATAAGLFAAIPAVIGYNHFIHRIKAVASQMDDFSVELVNLVERSFS